MDFDLNFFYFIAYLNFGQEQVSLGGVAAASFLAWMCLRYDTWV